MCDDCLIRLIGGDGDLHGEDDQLLGIDNSLGQEAVLAPRRLHSVVERVVVALFLLSVTHL